MSTLKEKVRETPSASKSSNFVSENTVTLNNYLSSTMGSSAAPFGSRANVAYDHDGSLPSIFRANRHVALRGTEPSKALLADSDRIVPALLELHPSKVTAAFSPYMAAALFLSFVAGATAAHFGTTTFQALEPITTPDKGTVRLPPVQAHPQKSATEPATASLAAAAFFPTVRAAKGGEEGLSSQLAAPAVQSLDDRQAWSETVETSKQLVAQQKTSPPAGIKEAENEKLFKEFVGWLGSKPSR
jgi:hypothetical protein